MTDRPHTPDPRHRRSRGPEGSSAAELEATAEAVRQFAKGYPAQSHSVTVDAEHGRLILMVTVEDDAAFERELRERFGSVVDAYFRLHGRRATRIEAWRVAPDGRTIEATWTGRGDERDHRLDAEERDGEIHLTASCITQVGTRRAQGGNGPEVRWGSRLVGYARSASVTLTGPVGDRRIFDDQRDRIHDRPPVSRSKRRDAVWLGLTVLKWVNSLDWAQGAGSQGPGANGWIRIYATVDDTERLRAAIEEEFGPGFEVVYRPPARRRGSTRDLVGPWHEVPGGAVLVPETER